jgi:hypothetical protein
MVILRIKRQFVLGKRCNCTVNYAEKRMKKVVKNGLVPEN